MHCKLGFCNSFPFVRTTTRYHERNCVSSCWCMLIDFWWLLHFQLRHETVGNFRIGSFIKLSNTELLIVVSLNVCKNTLKTTPGPSSPSPSARSIEYMSKVLASWHTTDPQHPKKTCWDHTNLPVFFPNRMGVLYFTTIMSQLPEKTFGNSWLGSIQDHKDHPGSIQAIWIGPDVEVEEINGYLQGLAAASRV